MLGPAADQFPQKAAQRALLAGIRNFGHRITALAEKSAGLQAAVQPVLQTGILAAVGRIGQNISPAVGVVQHAGGKGAQVECLFLLGGDGKHITLTYNIRSVILQQKICIFRYFVLYFASCAHVLEFNNATF